MEEENKARVGLTESEDYICLEDLQDTQVFPGINPVNLDYFGSEQCAPGYSFGPFVRENYVLHIVRKGRGTLKKAGKTYEIVEAQAFLIFPGETATYQADRKDPWNYMWIGFHGFRAEGILLHAGFTRENPVVVIRDMESLNQAVRSLLAALDLTYSGELLRTAGLYLIMGLLAANHEQEAEGHSDESHSTDYRYVKRAVDLITRSYRNHLKVEDIAKEIGISRNYLSGIFKREMGISPQEFLIDYRLEVAASLLRNTENQINVIALEVGYGDPLSFSKAFRRKYKMSPTDYRDQKPELVTYSMKGEHMGKYPL